MSSDSTTIEVQDEVQMAEAEKEQWQKRSIYKLPACIKNTNPTAYTPQLVSLGPYHYEDKNLTPMDIHKDRAVKHFLNRSRLNYDDCVQSLSGILRELMDAYDWLDDEIQHREQKFLDLMTIDGIFILEITGYWEWNVSDYAHNDPIFSTHGALNVILPIIKRDMLMLENQIPMKVLHKLYCLQPKATEADATKVIFKFLLPNKTRSTPPSNSLHILDMYRTAIIGTTLPYQTGIEGHIPSPTDTFLPTSTSFIKIKSMVELNEVGIKFMGSTYLDDITFHDGVLRLPQLIITNGTEALFLNLMAFERFHCGIGNDNKD